MDNFSKLMADLLAEGKFLEEAVVDLPAYVHLLLFCEFLNFFHCFLSCAVWREPPRGLSNGLHLNVYLSPVRCPLY